MASKPGVRISFGSLVRSPVWAAAACAISLAPSIVAANQRKWWLCGT